MRGASDNDGPMADQLKTFFGPRVVNSIADDVHAAHAAFPRDAFVTDALKGLDGLELVARGGHIAEALRRHLPQDFGKAAKILIASLGPKLESSETFGMAPFRYLPHVVFAARYGLQHLEPALRLQYELTQRFSAEYSIRAFLEAHPEATYTRLLDWARDPSVHVRRLVSEGTRPRLPWAPRLRAFQKDPAPVLRLLELLKDDPELYVRRSVANSLNDIGKDHPRLLIDVCRRWSKGASAERRWVIGHALRSLIKKGDRDALAVIGFAAAPRIEIGNVRWSARRVRIGGKVAFTVDIRNAARGRQDLLVDFRVFFVKANGTTAAKVFKIRRAVLEDLLTLTATVSFQILTTRKPYPGLHRFELLVNGHPFELGAVRVIP
jgi:3-methyladenine DNA glycosylase AlkC